MKKYLNLLFLFVLGLFTVPLIINAEVTDNTGPTLNEYSFPTTTLYFNETTTIEIDATDDISGVAFAQFMFKNVNDNTRTTIYVNNLNNGKGTYTTQAIGGNIGNYELERINLIDKSSNITSYVAKKYASTCATCKTAEDITIEIKKPENLKYPHIESINISKTNINPGEEVTFTITVDSETVSSITLLYSKNIININTSNSKTITKTVNNFDIPGFEYELQSITVEDQNGLSTYYNKTNNLLNLSNYKITVSGEKDTTPPELKSFKITNSNNTVYAPGILKAELSAIDNLPNNIKEVHVNFMKKGGKTTYGFMCYGNDSGYTCNYEINQYFDTGTYYITSIEITDNTFNTSYYSYNSEKEDHKIDYVEFIVDTDTKSDVVSSTINNEMLDKIKNAKDDATISLDSTKNSIVKKEIFDAIYGTNKTLIIESNGIQWIFNGQKITNETKDIDVKVNIYQNREKDDDSALNSVNSIMIDFAKNGLLPGVAKVRIKADYALKDFIGINNLYVYYYDPESELLDPVAQQIDMTEDGYYEFYIEHNSKYMIANSIPNKKYISEKTDDLVINNIEDTTNNYEIKDNTDVKLDNKEIVSENNKDTKKDNKLPIILVSILAIIIIIIIIVIIVKKKTNKKTVEEVKQNNTEEKTTDNNEKNDSTETTDSTEN